MQGAARERKGSVLSLLQSCTPGLTAIGRHLATSCTPHWVRCFQPTPGNCAVTFGELLSDPRVINTPVGVQGAFLCMVSAIPEDWWTEHCPWEMHMLRLLMQGLLPRVFY